MLGLHTALIMNYIFTKQYDYVGILLVRCILNLLFILISLPSMFWHHKSIANTTKKITPVGIPANEFRLNVDVFVNILKETRKISQKNKLSISK